MAGKAARRECQKLGVNDRWEQRRVVYDLADVAGAPFVVQPSQFTSLFQGTPPEPVGPEMAVVNLHSVAATRLLAEPTDQIVSLATSDLFPPIARPGISADPAADVQRGGFPQYRVIFNDGSPQATKVYCDGNSVLSLPARNVTVDILTPPILEAETNDPLLPVGPGLIVQADAAAHVAWTLHEGGSAPMGEATYTQVYASLPAQRSYLFERPPFGRDVTVIGPLGVAITINFLCGQATICATPPGVANTLQQPQPVPHTATHVGVVLGGAPPPGSITTVIWHLGVN